jgi:hypothetical protein
MHRPIVPHILPILTLAACNDAGLTKFNAEPVAEITSHAADEDGNPPSVYEGALVTFTGEVSDPDDAFTSLSVVWYLGDEVLCEAAPADEEGGSSCEGRTDLGSDSVRMVVSDPENKTATASVALAIVPTDAPDAIISAPLEVGRYYEDIRLTFEGTVTDTEDSPEDLSVVWESDLDGVLDVANEPDSAGTLIGRTSLSEGEHLITLRVEDTHGKVGTDAVAVTVGPANRAPDCALNRPADASVWVFGETISFAGLASDADVDAEELDWALRSDIDGLLGVGTPANTGDLSLDTDTLSKGTHVVTLEVADEVEASCEDTIQVIVDTPPEVEITEPADGTEQNEDEPFIVRGAVSDEQDTAPSLDIVWESDVDGVLDTTPATSGGALYFSGTDLTLGVHVLTVTVTDSVGLSAQASITIEVNGLPTAPGVSILPADPGSGDDLVANIDTASTDPDGDTVTYMYAWTQNGVSTSHTSDTVPAADTAKDDVWEVTVTPTDGLGSGAPAAASATVGNGVPTVDSASISPTGPTTDETLTVTATGSDPDGDPVALTYEWFVDGLSTGQTGTSLDGGTWFDKDQVVWVEVVASDGEDSSAATTTASVTVVNTPPEAPTIDLSPAAPRSSNDDIVCEVTAAGDDDDGDSQTYTFDWTVDGVAFTGAFDDSTSSTVDAADVDEDAVWVCTVTPNDGDDDGATASATVTAVKGFEGWPSTSVSLGDSDWLFVGEDLSDYAGWAVGAAGDVDGDGLDDLLIGAYNAGDGSVRTGMAFIVAAGSLSASGTLDLSAADWRFIGEDASDQAGKHVAGAGDVDDDGYADILVGAPNLDATSTNEGGVYVYLGGDLGTVPDVQLYDAHAVLTGEAGGDRVGEAAVSAGDVDGDGMADLLVGASGNDDAGTGAGKAYLLYGDGVTGDIDLGDADFGWTGEAAGDAAGASVAGLGDVDGDGTDDLLVGAWGSDDAASNAGQAYILLGGSLPADGAPLSSASITLLGEGADDFAAYAAAGPGDVDGDGLGDILLGAYGDAPAGSRSGRSYLVYASSLSGLSTLDLGSADHRFSGEAGSDLSGIRVAGAGDVDNDGLADLMVSAPANDSAGSNAGSVYLILAENIPATRNVGLATVDYAFTGEAIGDQAGYGIAGLGDVDGDGFGDMLIGSWGDNDGGLDAGKAYLMRSP